MLTYATILDAEARIRPHLLPTPLERAPELGENIHLKLENANLTHAFKIRGALNAVLSLDEVARSRGIITASSGNHAQGVAYAAHLTQTRAHILMPKNTPDKKVRGVQRWGAHAIRYGDNYDQTEAEALRRARDEAMTYISAYNDWRVMAGAGTIGLEILDALPDVARVVVCVSGGGLIGGIATAIKAQRPQAEVVGVNAQAAPAMYNRFYQTALSEQWDTLAEALSGDIEADAITVPIALERVDRMLIVSEASIARAIRWMVDVQGWLVEGGGAVGIAAFLDGQLQDDGRKTAIVVSGGNIDGATLRHVLSGG